jgi:transposase
MPKIIRVALTPEQLDDLNARARGRDLAPHERERLEMIRLSHLGHTIPQIAAHLGRHQQTVRRVISGFLTDGFAILADRPRPGRPATLTDAVLAAVEQRLDADAAAGRTWTMPHLVAWLRDEHGVTISPAWLGERLKGRRFRWKRTQQSVRHKRRDPDLQATKAADLEVLKS